MLSMPRISSRLSSTSNGLWVEDLNIWSSFWGACLESGMTLQYTGSRMLELCPRFGRRNGRPRGQPCLVVVTLSVPSIRDYGAGICLTGPGMSMLLLWFPGICVLHMRLWSKLLENSRFYIELNLSTWVVGMYLTKWLPLPRYDERECDEWVVYQVAMETKWSANFKNSHEKARFDLVANLHRPQQCWYLWAGQVPSRYGTLSLHCLAGGLLYANKCVLRSFLKWTALCSFPFYLSGSLVAGA